MRSSMSNITLPHLSPREQSVMDGLMRGLVTKEIGAELGISPHTAKTYIERILRKTNTKRRQEAVNQQVQQILAGQVGFSVPITFLPARSKAA